VKAVVGAVLATVVALQPATSSFYFDAGGYWNLAKGLVGGGSFLGDETLALRGALTSVLYLPAAVVTELGGNSLAGPAVLAENSVLIAVIGVVLIPALVALWRPVTVPVVVVSALGAGALLGGFAPFPLTDLWAAALLLAAVVALRGRTASWLLAAGLAAGAAFNIRPATLLPLVAVGVAVLVARRLSAVWFVLGAALALIPQVLVNLRRGSPGMPWPEMTGALSKLQSSYAAYVVRYDTVFAGSVSAGPAVEPRRFFCSPGMADALDGRAPESPGELAAAFLGHLPQALVFSVQKITAALHWPLSTPYTAPAPAVNALFALLVTAITVIGALALLRATLRVGRAASLAQIAAWIAWAGSAAILVTAATEARFALPLVLVGIAGCALLSGEGVRASGRTGRMWAAGTLIGVAAVYGMGVTGLQHPVDGPGTLEVCAAR
jgi:hypothetical protein